MVPAVALWLTLRLFLAGVNGEHARLWCLLAGGGDDCRNVSRRLTAPSPTPLESATKSPDWPRTSRSTSSGSTLRPRVSPVIQMHVSRRALAVAFTTADICGD